MGRKKIGIIEVAMRNRNTVILISLALIIIGIVGLLKMPRNEFPQFTIRQGVIVGVYPGATSSEVEDQLTRVVENYIFSYKEVKKAKTYSYSREGMMYIFVELNDDVKDADRFWSKLKHGLSELKMRLPSGVLALIANSDFGDTSALLITLSSDSKSYKELYQELKRLEAECRKIKAVSKIKHYGLQKEKIYVKIKPELLNEYNIKSLSLLGTYQLNGMVNYAGELNDGQNVLSVHLPPNFESEKDLAEQIVYSDPRGDVVRLKNIADIERRYEDPDSYIKQNGKKTILLSLEMQPGNNIVKFGEDVDKVLEIFKNQTSKDIEVTKISELPKYVKESVNLFLKEFIIAILAVILVIMFLLPLRVASVAGITIPISVFITLAILYFFGVELHTVSLASLILVLGMIVDNSIVVIDNHVEQIDHGMSSWYAAIKSAKDLMLPIIVATLAIIAAYVPLGFMVPGTAGEFLETIPIVIGIALIVSIAVAGLLVPYLNYMFIKKGLKKSKNNKKSFLDIVQKVFDYAIEKAFHFPKTILAITLIIVGLSFLLFKGLPQKLFPEMERNQFAVEVYLPTGASIEKTATVIDSLEKILLADKRITNVASFIGTSSPRFHTVYAPNMPASNYGQLLVNTISNEATREVVEEYKIKYADNFVNTHVKWKILAMEAAKSPIEIRISSDSVKNIRAVESQIYDILNKTDNLSWIRNDWDSKNQSIKVNLDKDKANRMGFSKGYVATSLMIGLDGIPLTTIWEEDYPVEVKLIQDMEKNKNITLLEDQSITSPMSFSAIPLRSFATFTPEWHEGTIVHRNGTRTLTVQIDNDSKEMASSIFTKLKPQIDNLILPQGTFINYGGDYEAQEEVFTPMTIALLISIILIFFIILFQFKKIKLTLLIMSTMILSFPGAAIGLYLMDYPFSITAFVGITSLCGMVVRNGIILIDYAKEIYEKSRMSIREVAIAATKRRMRPIFLTSAAAAVGVIPMILSRSPLWGPLGTVMCFGLLIAMVLTLFVLPILYWFAYRNSDKNLRRMQKHSRLNPIVLIFLLLVGSFTYTSAQTTYSLQQCKDLAIENNNKIKNSSLEIDAAKQVKRNAFTKYFPNISATGASVRFDKPLLDFEMPGGNLPVFNGNPATIPLATQFAYSPGISLSLLEKINTGAVMATQPIFVGGRIYYGNKLAKLGVNVSNHKLSMSKNEVLLKTEELYQQIISLTEKKKTVEFYSSLLDTLYKDVNNAYNAGLITNSDLLKVSIKQSELAINKLKLNNGIKLATMALCQHIGVKYDSTIVLSDSIINIPNSASLFMEPEKALPELTEYKLMQEAVKAERLQKNMKRGEYMPEIAVGAGAFTFDMNEKWTNNAMLFGMVKIPISDWWGGAHSIKEHKIKEQIVRNNAEDISELLILKIQKVWNELEESYQKINLCNQSIKQAEANLKISNDNYKAGLTNISDLLEAQAMLQQTKDELTDALTDYKLKTTMYLQATGR